MCGRPVIARLRDKNGPTNVSQQVAAPPTPRLVTVRPSRARGAAPSRRPPSQHTLAPQRPCGHHSPHTTKPPPPVTMAPFTVSTRGVVLGGKAENSLHSDLQELGRDDVKGALRVDAATNVKDTDLVFTTTDHTVRTVRLFFGVGRGAMGAPRPTGASRRRREKKKATALRHSRSPGRAARRARTLPRCAVADAPCARAASRRLARLPAFWLGCGERTASRVVVVVVRQRRRTHRSSLESPRPPRPARACATHRAAPRRKPAPCASPWARARPVFTCAPRARRCRSFSAFLADVEA